MSAYAFPHPGRYAGHGPRKGSCRPMSRHRHRGRPDFGPGGFGGGPGFGFAGPGGSRRRMRRGDVRSAVLVLLAEQPDNGYGLMGEIESRSEGAWRPSPGSIYPVLAQLEDEGLVTAEESGGRKQFTLTDAGRAHVETNRESLGEPWANLESEVGEGRLELRRLLWQLGAAAMQVATAGTDAQVAQARKVIVDARKALYRLLAEDEEQDADES